MKKKRIQKSIVILLIMGILTLVYVIVNADDSDLVSTIHREDGGSKQYRALWQGETITVNINYKKQGEQKEALGLLSKEKTKSEQLQEYVRSIEKSTRQEASFLLPDSYLGEEIVWEKTPDKTPLWLILAGVVLSIAVYIDQGRQEDRQREEYRQQLLQQYPQLVGVLTVLLDGGMSLRYAIGRMTVEHLGGEGPLQQELERLLKKLQNGMGMNQALLEFAETCNVKQYRKLVSLLIQNQEKGTSGAKQMLALEVQESENMRLQNAIQAGEKAQTKLLLPMSLLLGLVIVILMVPAWMQIGGR